MKSTTSQNSLMVNIEQMSSVLSALPDPAFLLSRSGKCLAVFGGKDTRYYHDGRGLVGSYVSELVRPEKAKWFIDKIQETLQSGQLLIVEYELSNKDVKKLNNEGPNQPIWFEGRINTLDFRVDGEEVVLWVASNTSVRHNLEVKLRDQSDKDQLTSLFNRRRLEQDLTSQREALVRYSVSTSILIFDIDNFKAVNDTYGHHAGDEIIITVANAFRSRLRITDAAYRLGGDEFVIVLPNTGLEDAIQLADRLREKINLEINRCCIEETGSTVSIGVTDMRLADESYEATLKRADSFLYKAKREGKNKVVSS